MERIKSIFGTAVAALAAVAALGMFTLFGLATLGVAAAALLIGAGVAAIRLRQHGAETAAGN